MTTYTDMLEDATILDVYVYYDGPQLFLAQTDDGKKFLAVSTENNEDHTVFLYTEVEPETLTALENGTMDLYTAFRRQEFLGECKNYGTRMEWTAVFSKHIPDNQLPTPGTFLPEFLDPS